MSANRKYKDSVFRFLFKEKDKSIELYNAINNTNYTLDVDFEETTLKGVLFLNRINDIAFRIDKKFVFLGEDQSLSDFLDNDCYPERIGHREKEYNADRMAV